MKGLFYVDNNTTGSRIRLSAGLQSSMALRKDGQRHTCRQRNYTFLPINFQVILNPTDWLVGAFGINSLPLLRKIKEIGKF
jgi:hypothetical protein